jgi:hypothetical protein
MPSHSKIRSADCRPVTLVTPLPAEYTSSIRPTRAGITRTAACAATVAAGSGRYRAFLDGYQRDPGFPALRPAPLPVISVMATNIDRAGTTPGDRVGYRWL